MDVDEVSSLVAGVRALARPGEALVDVVVRLLHERGAARVEAATEREAAATAQVQVEALGRALQLLEPAERVARAVALLAEPGEPPEGALKRLADAAAARRVPELDQYAPGPAPAEALAALGRHPKPGIK
ncbi:hypothetical protein DRW03_21190 [Corallococcus sp. H22C18031201]|nr:hypothetical protein DRW03_21190 [Corallococcus sp. H22C18031201]